MDFAAPDGSFAPGESDDLEERNKPLRDEDIDQLLPPSDGYLVFTPPQGGQPTPKAAPFHPPAPTSRWDSPWDFGAPKIPNEPVFVRPDLPAIKGDDFQNFKLLLDAQTSPTASEQEQNTVKLQEYLLLIKCGTEEQRKTGQDQLLADLDRFPIGDLLQSLLMLIMSPSIDEQSLESLGKAFIRVILKKDDLVRPYTHKMFVVIEPLLLDQLVATRDLGRRMIAATTRAVGLATVIAVKRPDIESNDEFVRLISAKTLAVAAVELGVEAFFPFLRAICGSQRSPLARHCGIKIVQQIADLMKQECMPHLTELLRFLRFEDDDLKVRVISLLALASLIDAVGDESIGVKELADLVTPLWRSLEAQNSEKLRWATLKACERLLRTLPDDVKFFYAQELIPHALDCARAIGDDTATPISVDVLINLARSPSCAALLKENSIIETIYGIFWSPAFVGRHVRSRHRLATLSAVLFPLDSERSLQNFRNALKSPQPLYSLGLDTVRELDLAKLENDMVEDIAAAIVEHLERSDAFQNAYISLEPLFHLLSHLGMKSSALAARAAEAAERMEASGPASTSQISKLLNLIDKFR